MRIIIPPVINEFFNVGPEGGGASINYSQVKVQTPPTIATGATKPAIVASCEITTNGGPVQVTVYGDAYNTTSPIYGVLNLYRGLVAIGHRTVIEGSAINENQEFSLSVIDEPQEPGTYTYYLKLTDIGGADITFGEKDGPLIYAVELQNIIGPRGYTGEAGPRGFTGTQGAQGTQGSQGTQGTQGLTGSQGTQGTQGTQGSQGTQGTQGTAGSNGSQGAQGTQGPLGGAAIVCVAKPAADHSPGAVGQVSLFDNEFFMYVTNVATGVSGWVRWDIKTGGGFSKF